MNNITRIQQRRAAINQSTVNKYIMSQILGYLYPTKKQIDLKALLDIPKQIQLVPDIYTRTNSPCVVKQYMLKIKEVLKNILDVCSECLLINPVYFNKGKHLCPICGSGMVNHNKFKFNALKEFTVKIYKESLIIFKTNMRAYNPTRSLVVDLNPGLNGIIAVMGQKQGWSRSEIFQYECNYKDGLLEGPHKYIINNHTIQLKYVKGLRHGKRIIQSENGQTIEIFYNGLLEGNYQKFDIQQRLIIDYNYKCGQQEGVQTTYTYARPLVNYITESIELNGPIIEITEYQEGKKNGVFIAKQGEKVLCQQVYLNNLVKCIETVHRDQEGKITYKHTFAPNELESKSTKTYITYTLTKPEIDTLHLTPNLYSGAFTETENVLGLYYYDKIVQETYVGIQMVSRTTNQNGIVTTDNYTNNILIRREVRQNITLKSFIYILEHFENGRIMSRQTRNEALNQHKNEVFYSTGNLRSSKEFRNRLIKYSTVQQNHGYIKEFAPDGSIISSLQYDMGKLHKIPRIRKGPQNIN